MQCAKGCVAAVGAALLESAVSAQDVVPFDPQFQVNTYTSDDQRLPSASVGPDGGFVVVWVSRGSPESDNSFESIQAQRFNSAGERLSSQFQVNSYVTDVQRSSSVSVGPDGDFVVAWASDGSPDSDSSGYSIQGQRFSSGGGRRGSQFQVNTYTTNSQFSPSVSVGADRGFVVAWDSLGSAGSDNSFLSIQAQRYGSGGGKLGSQFQVNSYTAGDQALPSVSVGPDGEFVVAWQSAGSPESDNSGRSIQALRYSSMGMALSSQFQVNTFTTDMQDQAWVFVGPDNGFVVTWRSDGSFGPDTSSYSIQAQRYDSGGAELGTQFQVNSYTPGSQAEPSASAGPDGTFVVTWTSQNSPGSDNSGGSVQAQRFSSAGVPLGSQTQVNTFTTSNQGEPSVSAGPDGGFVAAWRSDGSFESDDSFNSIQAQRYVARSSLQVQKLDAPDPVRAGGTLTYGLLVTNAVESLTAHQVELTDTLPGSLSLHSAIASTGTCSAVVMSGPPVVTELTCRLGDLEPGESAQVLVVVDVAAGATGPIENTAQVRSSRNPDPDPTDNLSTQSTSVNAATATPTAPPATVTPTVTPTATPGFPDADGDGVIDALDTCPDTPPGSFVDSNGCPGSKLSLTGQWWTFVLLAAALASVFGLARR